MSILRQSQSHRQISTVSREIGYLCVNCYNIAFQYISGNLVLPGKYQLLLTLSAKPNPMPVSPTAVMNFTPYKHARVGGKAWWKVEPTTSCPATRQPAPSPRHQDPTYYAQLRYFHLRSPLARIPLSHAVNPSHRRDALAAPVRRYCTSTLPVKLPSM